MSDSGGPTRRRRIAGESNPAAKKTTAKKVPATKKVAAKKAPAAKKASVAKKATPPEAPVANKATVNKVATARTPAPATAAAKKVEKAPLRTSAQGSDRPTKRDLRWLVPAALLALASLVLGGILAFQGVQDITEDDGARESNEKAASSAASSAAETIFSYTFNNLDEHLTDSKKLMTSSFATDFEKIAPALDEIAPQRKVQVQAVSRNAAALSCGDECSPGTVTVLLFLDQARLVDGAKDPDVIGNRITMKMVRRDGVWLVDDIRAV